MPAATPSTLRGLVGVIVVGLVVLLGGVAVVATQRADTPQADDDDPLAGPTYYATPAAVCGLFEPEELSLALGYRYQTCTEAVLDSPALSRLPGVTKAVYPAKEGVTPVHVGVVYAYAEQVFERRKEAVADPDALEDLEGLGRQAILDRQVGEVLVLTDDKIVGFNVPGLVVPRISGQEDGEPSTTVDERMLERTRRLAEKALERLR